MSHSWRGVTCPFAMQLPEQFRNCVVAAFWFDSPAHARCRGDVGDFMQFRERGEVRHLTGESA